MATTIENQIVPLPEGFVLDVPDASSALPPGFVLDVPEEQEVVPDEPQQGFVERVQEGLETRRDEFGEIIEARLQGDQGVLETALQIVGKGIAGPIFDVVGEGLVSAFRALPDELEQPLRDKASEIMQSEIGQMGLRKLQEGQEAFDQFKTESPRAARNIESIVNTALLFAPAFGKKAPGEQGIAGRLAEKVKDKATAQVAAKETKALQEFVSPKQTAAVRTEQARRTTIEGTEKIIQPSIAEARMIEVVRTIPEVKTAKTVQGKLNAVKEAGKQEAIKLKSALSKEKIIFTKREVLDKLTNATRTLKENPLLVGDASKTAEKIMNKARQLIAKNKGTPSGLLQARKELDAWVKQQKGSSVFDAAKDNAVTIAVKEIRTTMNDFLASKATSTGVKESLSRQSTLFGVMDNVAPKAADEAATRLGRLAQNVENFVKIPTKLAGTLAAMSALFASAIVAPGAVAGVVGAGIAGAGAKKAITSATAKKALSELLKLSDKAIIAAKNSPQTLLQLRADRAALLEILKGEE